MNHPKHLMSEANIQAEFYSLCKQLKLNCTLELSTPAGRIDCGIFSDDWLNLIAIVECKKNILNKYSKQIQRYKTLGVPVYGLNRMDSLSLAMTIKNSNFIGVKWDLICDIPKIERRHRRGFNPAFDVDEMINFKAS